MSLDTYSNLKTEIADWLHRADLTTKIDTFIDLCEADMNRKLRVQNMEARATATLDEQWESLPTGFLEMRSLQITGNTGRELEYVSPDMLNRMYKTTDTGMPLVYTIADEQLGFGPTPDQSYTMEIVYYSAVTALSASNTTNWILTNHPDAYLAGSLYWAQAYLKDDPRVAEWKSLYEMAIDNIRGEDSRRKYPSGVAKRIRPA